MSSAAMLHEEQLAISAAKLLSTSNVARYTNLAMRLADQWRPALRLESDLNLVLRRSRDLWKTVVGSTMREPAEIELAILLASVRRVSATEVDAQLAAIARSTRPAAAWLAGMARNLIAARPSNLEVRRRIHASPFALTHSWSRDASGSTHVQVRTLTSVGDANYPRAA